MTEKTKPEGLIENQRPTRAHKVGGIILAAGEGKRMCSDIAKPLHPVANYPMCFYVLDALHAVGAKTNLVLGSKSDQIIAALDDYRGPKPTCYYQHEQLGTAHAVLAARDAFSNPCDSHPCDAYVIAFGDSPLLRPEVIGRLLESIEQGADVALGAFVADNPYGYGRLVCEGNQCVAIIEQANCDAESERINLCNGGVMALAGPGARDLLDSIERDPKTGEFFLTEIARVAHMQGKMVQACMLDETDVLGVNDMQQLAAAEALMQQRLRQSWMSRGVRMPDPASVMLSHDFVAGRDVVIEPSVVIERDVVLGDRVTVRSFSHLAGCTLASGVSVGPFARIRHGSVLDQDVRVGNFVELKNTHMRSGSKASHLAYLGDGEIGQHSNIGAGVIFCNFDGTQKSKTKIGSNSFIGSNSALVAPVEIGSDAYIASGSVITDKVPDDTLSLARARQVNKPGWKMRSKDD